MKSSRTVYNLHSALLKILTHTCALTFLPRRAISMYYNDRPGWEALVARIMQQDWSWYSPALDYLELYYKALLNT